MRLQQTWVCAARVQEACHRPVTARSNRARRLHYAHCTNSGAIGRRFALFSENEHESADSRPDTAMSGLRRSGGPVYGGRKHVSRTEIRSGVTVFSAEAAVRRRHTLLVVYRGASDVAAKGAMFVITVVAARQLTRDGSACSPSRRPLAGSDRWRPTSASRCISRGRCRSIPSRARICSGDGCRCELPPGSRR